MIVSKLKKTIVIPIAFMVLIIFLAIISEGKLIHALKHRFSILVPIKSKIQDSLHIKLTFSQVQNFLHIPFFVLLAFLWMKFFSVRKLAFKKAFVYTFLITAIFALFQEFSQAFIPDRDFSFLDLFLNFLGSLSGITCIKFLARRRLKLCQMSNN